MFGFPAFRAAAIMVLSVLSKFSFVQQHHGIRCFQVKVIHQPSAFMVGDIVIASLNWALVLSFMLHELELGSASLCSSICATSFLKRRRLSGLTRYACCLIGGESSNSISCCKTVVHEGTSENSCLCDRISATTSEHQVSELSGDQGLLTFMNFVTSPAPLPWWSNSILLTPPHKPVP